MKIVGIFFWLTAAVYSALCVVIREIRFFCWKGSDTKLGTVTYIGMTLFLWIPSLVITELVPKDSPYSFLLFLVVLLAFFLMTVGYFMDVSDS
jgi:hypothetical protein